WSGQQFDGDFGDDGKQPFASGDECQQVITGRVKRLAAEFDRVAGDQYAADAADVMHGKAVFQAVDAARVLRDVAADRTGDLRRRVWRVIQAIGRDRLGDREVTHARLHDSRARFAVDRNNPVELRERENDAGRCRHSAARQTRARAARDDRNTRLVTPPQNRDDLRFGVG